LENRPATFAGQPRAARSSFLQSDPFAHCGVALRGTGEQLGCASIHDGDDRSPAVHACDGFRHVQALWVNLLFGLVDEKPQQLLHCDPEPDQAQRLKVFLEPLYLLGTLHEEALASLLSEMLTFTIKRA
jgi:hypothetical protein